MFDVIKYLSLTIYHIIIISHLSLAGDLISIMFEDLGEMIDGWYMRWLTVNDEMVDCWWWDRYFYHVISSTISQSTISQSTTISSYHLMSSHLNSQKIEWWSTKSDWFYLFKSERMVDKMVDYEIDIIIDDNKSLTSSLMSSHLVFLYYYKKKGNWKINKREKITFWYHKIDQVGDDDCDGWWDE